MNHFEERMNALRLQFTAERAQITKDAYRHIGHLNTAIGQVNTPEAREALRAEKVRVYEAMRTSHKYNRLCFLQQLEMLEDEYRLHREQNPSLRQLRRLMASLCKSAEANGQSSISFSFGRDNRRCDISFR